MSPPLQNRARKSMSPAHQALTRASIPLRSSATRTRPSGAQTQARTIEARNLLSKPIQVSCLELADLLIQILELLALGQVMGLELAPSPAARVSLVVAELVP